MVRSLLDHPNSIVIYHPGLFKTARPLKSVTAEHRSGVPAVERDGRLRTDDTGKSILGRLGSAVAGLSCLL